MQSINSNIDLRLDQVKEGDLLFNFRKEKITAQIISAAQRIFMGLSEASAAATHVGIIVGKDEVKGTVRVAEATGFGHKVQVIEYSLQEIESRKEGLASVRIESEALREKVAEVAHQWASSSESGGNFNVGHLLTSPIWSSKFGIEGRLSVAQGIADTLAGTGRLATFKDGEGVRQDYYCSEFALEVYQTAKALLDIDFSKQEELKAYPSKDTLDGRIEMALSAGKYLYDHGKWEELIKDSVFAQEGRYSSPGRLLHRIYQETDHFTVTRLFVGA